jgi:hypothetical protein
VCPVALRFYVFLKKQPSLHVLKTGCATTTTRPLAPSPKNVGQRRSGLFFGFFEKKITRHNAVGISRLRARLFFSSKRGVTSTGFFHKIGLAFDRAVTSPPLILVFRKNLAAHMSIKKGQFLSTLRRFFQPMPCIALKKSARLDKNCLLF